MFSRLFTSAVILASLWPAIVAQSIYSNPIVYSDFADNDVSQGPDGAYYFSASSFQFSPGAPILKSYDLVNWDFIGHSVPMLDFGAGYNMTGTPSWVGGIWASTMRYRKSNGKWYWIGCVNFWTTYIYTASDVTGPWTQASSYNNCYYDCGLLIDDDDTMYVVYGNTNPSIAQLSADGLSEVKTQQTLSTPAGFQGLEGNRLYKINGTYYWLNDSPQGATFIWKSSNVWGPYTGELLQSSIGSPLPGGGLIDQGSLVETPGGQWYFMSCSWDYPSGRIPVMAPITWNSTGWPKLTEVNGAWGASYPFPDISPHPMPSFTGTDTFQGTSLAPAWEWNFNPDTTKFQVNNGLTLYTATVTNDLYATRNVLTHRLYGPTPYGTVEIDFTNMADGDQFGLAAFRDQSAWIGVQRTGSTYAVQMVTNAIANTTSWETISVGTTVASSDISIGKIWLRVAMNAMPNSNKLATFYYSTDGSTFKQLGTTFEMDTSIYFFTGYRYAIFTFANKALGGSIKILSFTDNEPNPVGTATTTTAPKSALPINVKAQQDHPNV